MGSNGDFIEWLGTDMSNKVFMHLDDPSDLARVCCVSSSWRRFVIGNGLCKQLCLKLLPEMYSGVRVIESDELIDPIVRKSEATEWECLKRNHRVFAQLTSGLSPILQKDCISEAISASTTDNYPEESIWNTLEMNNGIGHGASYWSSKGQSESGVPEVLVYKLISNLCLVTEIHIQPFQAYFQDVCPIYSSKSVRFRLGHPKLLPQSKNDITVISPSYHSSMDDQFSWTYTSPEYPMKQENCLQKFELPEPVLCIGGILQIELLGRVQRQEIDGKYYICISHVQAVGRPLSHPFDVEILPAGKCTLKYYSGGPPVGKAGSSSRLLSLTARIMEGGIRGWENMILNTLLGFGAIGDEYGTDDD